MSDEKVSLEQIEEIAKALVSIDRKLDQAEEKLEEAQERCDNFLRENATHLVGQVERTEKEAEQLGDKYDKYDDLLRDICRLYHEQIGEAKPLEGGGVIVKEFADEDSVLDVALMRLRHEFGGE